jgi:hypothetical protein
MSKIFKHARRSLVSYNRTNRKKLIKLQYKIFYEQTWLSIAVYVPSLVAMLYVVNFVPTWGYDTNVILSNLTFNVATAVIIVMGFVSLALSVEPDYTKMVKKMADYLTKNNFGNAEGRDETE